MSAAYSINGIYFWKKQQSKVLNWKQLMFCFCFIPWSLGYWWLLIWLVGLHEERIHRKNEEYHVLQSNAILSAALHLNASLLFPGQTLNPTIGPQVQQLLAHSFIPYGDWSKHIRQSFPKSIIFKLIMLPVFSCDM